METANEVSVTRRTTKHTMESVSRTPISQGRTFFITRSVPGAAATSSTTIRAESSRPSYMSPAGGRSLVNTGVSKFLEGRGKEKKDMQELNQRFGNYIEKTRFLEAQNRKLAAELKDLKDRWGIETKKIKQMYETEMQQLRKLLEESEKTKGELQVQVSTLEDREIELEATIEDLRQQDIVHRETIDKLHTQINDLESELAVLRRRVSKFDEERARDKKEMDRLRNEIQRLRKDLDAETLAHINAENEAASLRDELEFIKEVHEAELKELSSLAYRDTTAENRNFWRAELSQALQEIQEEYDSKVQDIKSELESVYTLRMQEVRTNDTRGSLENTHIKEENKRLKTMLNDLRDKVPMLEAKIANLEAQLADLQHELEEEKREHDLDNERLNMELAQTKNELSQIVDEVQILLDAKLSLELEIVAYRKLLDSEESRKRRQPAHRSHSVEQSSRLHEVLPPMKGPKPRRDEDRMGAEPVIEGQITAKSERGVHSAANGMSSSSSSSSTSDNSSEKSSKDVKPSESLGSSSGPVAVTKEPPAEQKDTAGLGLNVGVGISPSGFGVSASAFGLSASASLDLGKADDKKEEEEKRKEEEEKKRKEEEKKRKEEEEKRKEEEEKKKKEEEKKRKEEEEKKKEEEEKKRKEEEEKRKEEEEKKKEEAEKKKEEEEKKRKEEEEKRKEEEKKKEEAEKIPRSPKAGTTKPPPKGGSFFKKTH